MWFCNYSFLFASRSVFKLVKYEQSCCEGKRTKKNAYNQNMPFDEFSIAQIAGDLLPEGTTQQKVLAGFNRNNGTTDEGGAFAEEYRVEYAVDRVKTTMDTTTG